ncbi:MAG TPA: glycosyltransferase family 39 protein [bacterium]|nr:glycosyltransferase family 39 protein [bacterium]
MREGGGRSAPVDAGPPPWEGRHLSPGVYRWGLVLIAALGAALRLADLGRPFNGFGATGWNEGHYALIALNFDRYGLWSQHDDLGADYTFSPGVPWLIWLAFRLFGPQEWAARLPGVLFGVAAIVLVAALLRRRLGSEQVALTAAGFVATAPGIVYYAQNAQLDTPSITCALAAAVAMLRHRDSGRAWPLVGAGAWVALAVWFKFTTALIYPALLAWWWAARPRRPLPPAVAAAAFVALTVLPSAAWVLYGAWTGRTAASFYHRDWTLRGVEQALIEIPLIVMSHLFVPIGALLLAGIPVAWRWRARLRWLGIWCWPWVLLFLVFPYSSVVNRYYDLPATYLLVVVAALGLWAALAGRRSGDALGRAVLVGLAIVVGVNAAYVLWDPTTDRVSRMMTAHPAPLDPVPFYSAKVVARLPRGRTVVDAPQTMFYAGGDPAWVTLVGGDGDVRRAIDRETFDYILLNDYWHSQPPYYPIDDALRARLARHRYVQIAPAAWAHPSAGGGRRTPHRRARIDARNGFLVVWDLAGP